MVRRVALGLVLACGGFWVIGTLAMDYPDKFGAAERLTDTWRPVFAEEGLAQTRSDIDAFTGFADEFTAETVPALAALLGMTPAQFSEYVAANFPDTAAGVAGLSQIVPFFEGIVGGLEANQDEFRKADAIPTKNLPATIVPWGIVLLGVLALAAAAVGFARAAALPGALAAAGGIGLAAIAASLILSVPSKAQGFEDVTDSFRSTFSAEGVAQARASMDTVASMGTEVAGEVLPGLAGALNRPVEDLSAALGAQFPAVGAVLADLPGMLARFEGLVATLENTAGDFALADAVPTKGTAATHLQTQLAVPGSLLALAGGLGLALPALATRRRRHVAPGPEALAT